MPSPTKQIGERMDKHFTATTYILDKVSPRTLLHWHAKLQTWLPPGGHIEENETPYEAAFREVEEETGINNAEFIFNGSKPAPIDDRASFLEMPHFLLLELIEEGHYHLDWIYYAFVSSDIYDPNTHENTLKWYSYDDLKQETQIFENVRNLALLGLEKFYS